VTGVNNACRGDIADTWVGDHAKFADPALEQSVEFDLVTSVTVSDRSISRQPGAALLAWPSGGGFFPAHHL